MSMVFSKISLTPLSFIMNKWLYASLGASPQPAGVELPHCVPDVGLQLLVLGPQLVPATLSGQDSLLTQGQ